jgi:hypothetical protein
LLALFKVLQCNPLLAIFGIGVVVGFDLRHVAEFLYFYFQVVE